jgi:hypothetical protein
MKVLLYGTIGGDFMHVLIFLGTIDEGLDIQCNMGWNGRKYLEERKLFERKVRGSGFFQILLLGILDSYLKIDLGNIVNDFEFINYDIWGKVTIKEIEENIRIEKFMAEQECQLLYLKMQEFKVNRENMVKCVYCAQWCYKDYYVEHCEY